MRSNIAIIVIVSFIFSSIPLPAQQSQPKPYLAVMDLQVDEGLQKSFGPALSDKIRETIMSAEKYLIIDRGNIEIIMREIARGQEGCFDESCAVEAGRLLSCTNQNLT